MGGAVRAWDMTETNDASRGPRVPRRELLKGMVLAVPTAFVACGTDADSTVTRFRVGATRPLPAILLR